MLSIKGKSYAQLPLPAPREKLRDVQNEMTTGKRAVRSFSFASVHQFRLIFYKRKHPANVVCYSKGQQGNDNDQEQHPPEAQVFHKLLPCRAETGKNSFPLLQVWIKEGMAFHRTTKD